MGKYFMFSFFLRSKFIWSTLFFDIISSFLIKWNKLITAFLLDDKYFVGHLRGINEYDMAAILKETRIRKEIDD